MHRLTAKALHQHFCEGRVTAVEIAEYFLARIHQHDPHLGAFLLILEERALRHAQLLDQKKRNNQYVGKLAGIPVAIKDNMHIKGELTTCGSRFLENYKALFDATVIERLEQEGALILGKTNLDEFAMGSSTEHSAFKKVHNPWDHRYVPGGSSGGSAAAVASRMVLVALGSDTGGSIRQPASLCGISGFKPTYGKVSRYGLVAFGSSLDQIGPLATNVEDMGMIMEVISGHDPRDATSFPTHAEEYLASLQNTLPPKKIGVPYHFLENLSPSMKHIFQQALEVFISCGWKIVNVDLDILQYAVATYYIIAAAEAAANLARFDGVRYGRRSALGANLQELYQYSREEGFGFEVKKRIILGTYVLSSHYQNAFYTHATKVRFKMMEEFQKAFTQCDVIAMPTSPGAAFLLDASHDPLYEYLQDVFTIGANLARLPALSIPCGFDTNHLPLGLQLIGAYKEDLLLCQHAQLFQQHTQYHRAIPKEYQ